MLFYAISDDRGTQESPDDHVCKRRRCQNDCFNSQLARDVTEEREFTHKIHSMNEIATSTPAFDACQRQIRSASIEYDLPAFIECAKKLFNDNNSHLYDKLLASSDPSSQLSTYLLKQADFVNQAVQTYHLHFASSGSHQNHPASAPQTLKRSSIDSTDIKKLDAIMCETVVPSFFRCTNLSDFLNDSSFDQMSCN